MKKNKRKEALENNEALENSEPLENNEASVNDEVLENIDSSETEPESSNQGEAPAVFASNKNGGNRNYASQYNLSQASMGDYKPANHKDEYVLMPPIVQPVAVMPYISMEEKQASAPKTVSEVFEIIAPEYSASAARVSGFLSMVFSIITVLPFVLSMSNSSIPFVAEYVQAPNLATQLQIALKSSASITERLPAIMLTLGLFLMFVDTVLGAAALMGGTRIKFAYTGLAVMVLFLASQVIDKGFGNLADAIDDVSYVTVVGLGLIHGLLEVLATAVCPKHVEKLKKKDEIANNEQSPQ